MIICRGGILFISEPTLREQVTRETCVTLFTRHVRNMHEQRIPCTIEETFQYLSDLQTLYWHIIKREDGRPSGDGWKERYGSTYTESIVSIGYPSIGFLQGVVI